MNSEICVDGSGRVLTSGSALTSTPAPTALYSPDDINLVDLAVTHDGGVLGLFSSYQVDGERAVYEVRRFG